MQLGFGFREALSKLLVFHGLVEDAEQITRVAGPASTWSAAPSQ